MKKLLIAFAGLALSVVSAETYGITLNDPSVIKGTQLAPGDYKLELKDNSVVLARGKTRIELPVTVQTAEKKISGTSIVYGYQDGKRVVRAIRLGGTKTTLVFESDTQSGGSGDK